MFRFISKPGILYQKTINLTISSLLNLNRRIFSNTVTHENFEKSGGH